MDSKHGKVLPLSAAIAMALAGCSGGGGGSTNPIAGTPSPGGGSPVPITTVGTIDGFGSIYVNGIKFETSSASYKVDDEDAFDDSALSVGMIVKVKGEHHGDGTGRAMHVHYDDELEGMVESLMLDPDDDTIKTFTVLGVEVVASSDSTIFKGEDNVDFSWDTIADGDHVEISGDFMDGRLLATFIEKEDDLDEDVEAKGTILAFNGTDQFELELKNGTTLSVTLGPGAQIPAGGIVDGLFVEVEGTIPDPVNAPRSLLASEVEAEDHNDFDDDDNDDGEVEIEGMLSLDGDVWRIRGTELAFADGTEYRPLSLEDRIADGSAHGLKVEAKGDLVAGVLRVERLRLEDDDELEIKGVVESIDPPDATDAGTLTIAFPPALGTIAVTVNSNTMFADDDSRDDFDLSDLVPSTSFVEIHAHIDDAGNVVAGRLDAEDGNDEYEVEGPLDPGGYVAGVSITVLGVTFNINPGVTALEDREPRDGDSVDVEDENRDGTADSIDVED